MTSIMYEFVRDVVILAVTITVVILCIVCVIVICIVCCFPFQACNQRIDSRLESAQRDTETQFQQDNEAIGEVRARDLSQAPPPEYRNANQYENIDLEHTEVVQTKEAYRISSHLEPETTSLPPDYTSQRLSISAAPQEIQVQEGQLPPTYSTAQLELMARRIAMEQDTLRELTLREDNNIETDYHLPSDSQIDDVLNA